MMMTGQSQYRASQFRRRIWLGLVFALLLTLLGWCCWQQRPRTLRLVACVPNPPIDYPPMMNCSHHLALARYGTVYEFCFYKW